MTDHPNIAEVIRQWGSRHGLTFSDAMVDELLEELVENGKRAMENVHRLLREDAEERGQ